MTWPILADSLRRLTTTVTVGSPSPVKGVARAAVEVVALVAVEATVNAAIKTVALVAVKAAVNAAIVGVGVVVESPTQKQRDRTGTTDPLLNRITIVIETWMQ